MDLIECLTFGIDVIEGEIWKPVLKLYSFTSDLHINKEFDYDLGKYFVSDKGRFLSNNKLTTGSLDCKGYSVVSVYDTRFKMHQIVLQTFCPEGIAHGFSPDHIDKNKSNNSLSNLRWATREVQVFNRDNVSYKMKKVICLNNLQEYNSCKDAEESLGLPKNTVAAVARGDKSSVRGFKFQFN